MIMVVLILARIVAGHRHEALVAKRRHFLSLLLGDGSEEELAQLSQESPRLLGELSLELIQLVRGEERDQFIATATRLGIDAELRRRLIKGATRTRITAAEVLGDFPDDHSAAALEAALDDRSPDVRLAAALALAHSNRAPPVGLLVERLRLGTSERSLLITSLLADIARERQAEVRALIDDPAVPPPVKAAAIEALGATGDYSLVPVVNALALAADPSGEELPRYLRVLGNFQHPAGTPAVTKYLASPTWYVRAAAAEAAGKICLYELSYKLLAMLDDGDWWVRFRAGEALVRLGEPGRRLLGETARCGTERARDAARLTLAEQGVPA
ncbi:hypothetical protein HMF7854_07485 [Sphingomonas ginkgonis]|uniref:HEAT repeat domain-containing protein n=1 Tax=Sphingomonas ginkgonis TaxID=2315330 RepID=A0A429V9N4_9SPHN|nr:HEAT repeat domain-containing protein [Sphingomonas ginkgonis]RST30691.1 hypothetical protein HMF7854_07485 [Sphingomonas ginkgonis]